MCKHTESIRSYFEAATPEQIRDGKAWYQRARSLVFELSMVYGTTEETVAGIIAALSQRSRWATTVDRATRVLDGDTNPGGLPAATDKALAIHNGADPTQALGPRGYKIQAFYRALLGDDEAAVVDTWMLDALDFYHISKRTGRKYQSYTALQYQRLADILKAEARRAGLAVVEYQAIVWCSIRGNAD